MNSHTEKVLAEFRQEFGVMLPELMQRHGYVGTFEDIETFLTSALSSRDAEWRKRIEKLQKGDGVPRNDEMELHSAVVFTNGYHQALSDLLAVEEEASNK